MANIRRILDLIDELSYSPEKDELKKEFESLLSEFSSLLDFKNEKRNELEQDIATYCKDSIPLFFDRDSVASRLELAITVINGYSRVFEENPFREIFEKLNFEAFISSIETDDFKTLPNKEHFVEHIKNIETVFSIAEKSFSSYHRDLLNQYKEMVDSINDENKEV